MRRSGLGHVAVIVFGEQLPDHSRIPPALGDVEASLDPAKFVRIHRSYLLSLDRLSRVELDERENRVAVLTTGQRLPVSRAGYQRLSRAIE